MSALPGCGGSSRLFLHLKPFLFGLKPIIGFRTGFTVPFDETKSTRNSFDVWSRLLSIRETARHDLEIGCRSTVPD